MVKRKAAATSAAVDSTAPKAAKTKKAPKTPKAPKAPKASTKKPATNREREQIAQAELEAKERVFTITRKLIRVEEKLAAERRRFSDRAGELNETLRGAVEHPHTGKPEEKARIYDSIVMAWQDVDELEAERKSTLHPLLDDRDTLRKARREAVEKIDQYKLDFEKGHQ